jgi:hypothetical protein
MRSSWSRGINARVTVVGITGIVMSGRRVKWRVVRMVDEGEGGIKVAIATFKVKSGEKEGAGGGSKWAKKTGPSQWIRSESSSTPSADQLPKKVVGPSRQGRQGPG